MQNLEQQLYAYNVENERLKSDNVALKRKVEQLQTEVRFSSQCQFNLKVYVEWPELIVK